MNLLGRMLVTCLGLGYLRPAPGTWGSLPPMVLALMLVTWLGNRAADHALVNLTIINAVLLVGCAVSAFACIRWGGAAEAHFGKKDPGSVVADEVAGQCVALLLLPWQWTDDARGIQRNMLLAATAFVIFRVLDILKPPPARHFQRLQGGSGILIDDLIVGLYACILTHIAAILFPFHAVS